MSGVPQRCANRTSCETSEMTIKRAILSVSDKSGLAPLARFLTEQGVEILSTGGTARFLDEHQIPVTPISRYTGAPEILGGRVKTLHPRVFGGILFDRANPQHRNDCEGAEIDSIDLVVVNLYPFEATVARPGVTLADAVEQIDVGGPSMLRAAAKNHKDVVVLCNPQLYDPFMDEMRRGEVTDEFRRRAAMEVFRLTAAYDAAIFRYLGFETRSPGAEVPDVLTLRLERAQSLRYGENPQQSGAFYTLQSGSTMPFRQIQGKELSYNNILDLDAAARLAWSFEDPSCAIIKHTNPCGAAVSDSLLEAFRLAVDADPVSAFGGIIATNRQFDEQTAAALGSMFVELIVAPEFTPGALDLLSRKKNLRLIQGNDFAPEWELRAAAGGVLVQRADQMENPTAWRVVTKKEPSDEQRRSLAFAWTVCAHVKSNAIVIGRGTQTNGVGAGQMSRVDAARLAISKSAHPIDGGVAASDAFFPFRDGLDILVDAGVTAIVQPGGSVRDDEVIAAADERGISMIFTGARHFRH